MPERSRQRPGAVADGVKPGAARIDDIVIVLPGSAGQWVKCQKHINPAADEPHSGRHGLDEAEIALASEPKKCAICRSDTHDGARLCPHCRAARHRAFAETVTRPHPGTFSRARELRAKRKTAKLAQRASAATVLAERKAGGMAAADGAGTRSTGAGPRRLALPAAVLAAVLILAGGSYAAYKSRSGEGDSKAEAARADAPLTPTAASPAVANPKVPAATAAAAIVPASESASSFADLSTSRAFAGLAAKPPATGSVADAEHGGDGVPTLQRGQAKAAGGKALSRGKPAPVPAPMVAAEALVPPAPGPVTVAAAPVRELPKPDKWQLMNAALARCASQGLLSRFGCEQRVRLQYCEGAWGQVDQCVSAPVNDHGQ